jgi:hypothetical protein
MPNKKQNWGKNNPDKKEKHLAEKRGIKKSP